MSNLGRHLENADRYEAKRGWPSIEVMFRNSNLDNQRVYLPGVPRIGDYLDFTFTQGPRGRFEVKSIHWSADAGVDIEVEAVE
jgi:hypothetical protein